MRWAEGSPHTDYGYAGQRYDAGSALLFLHARYYDPALGRFISADTIVPKPGNPQDLNRYTYVRNNPTVYTDPSGHALIDTGGGGRRRREPPPPPPQILSPEPTPLPALLFIESDDRPEHPIDPRREEIAYYLNVTGAVMDTLAFGISTFGAVVEGNAWLVVACLDGLSPASDLTVAPAVALAVYEPFGIAEDYLGVAGLITTATADAFGGYTYFDRETQSGIPELVIGQDTIVEATTSGFGTLIHEGITDWGVNLAQMIYSWKSLGSNPRLEVRVSPVYGWQLVDYGVPDPAVRQ